tara:strand:- start:14469 stop:14702 length:234 start_codon:yes stop_codon:yes gene_type:complete
MNILKKIKSAIFTEPKYRYFKKIKLNYFGLCGSEVLVIMIEKNKGSYGELHDNLVSKTMKRKGYKECAKQYYDKHNK